MVYCATKRSSNVEQRIDAWHSNDRDALVRLLVLGARSWIGYRLAEAVRSSDPGLSMLGTSKVCNVPVMGYTQCIDAEGPTEIDSLINDYKPTLVVNLLRCENEMGMAIHRSVIDACIRSEIFYCYVSSALALDASPASDLTESVSACAHSPYGRFKQVCEETLLNQPRCQSLILRFSSIHGWSPYKFSRTESLLRKLSSNQTITVDQGVRQNRMLDTILVSAIWDLLRVHTVGVVHLGTSDSSEETEFLKRVASAFGLDSELIQLGQPRSINVMVRPQRIYELFGSRYKCTEQDTINGLLACSAFAGFRRGL